MDAFVREHPEPPAAAPVPLMQNGPQVVCSCCDTPVVVGGPPFCPACVERMAQVAG